MPPQREQTSACLHVGIGRGDERRATADHESVSNNNGEKILSIPHLPEFRRRAVN
jgi:hypothetical protein